MFARRLALVFAIVFCGSLAMAAAAFAAGGLGPGKYTFTNQSANAFFGMGKKGGPPTPSFMVSVNQGLNSFKPAHGPRTVSNDTVVYITEFDASGNGGFGCFIVPDSAFTVSRDMQSAALHATLTIDEACTGYATPVGGAKDVAFAGGTSGIALPVVVDVTWSANGPTSTFKNSFSFQCLKYTEDGNSTNATANASASGSISALIGQFNSDLADVTSAKGQLDINGLPPTGCFGY
jgi:hypothetical protein